jgi:hypothetical protein
MNLRRGLVAQRFETLLLLRRDPRNLFVRRGRREHRHAVDELRPAGGERERDAAACRPARHSNGPGPELI